MIVSLSWTKRNISAIAVSLANKVNNFAWSPGLRSPVSPAINTFAASARVRAPGLRMSADRLDSKTSASRLIALALASSLLDDFAFDFATDFDANVDADPVAGFEAGIFEADVEADVMADVFETDVLADVVTDFEADVEVLSDDLSDFTDFLSLSCVDAVFPTDEYLRLPDAEAEEGVRGNRSLVEASAVATLPFGSVVPVSTDSIMEISSPSARLSTDVKAGAASGRCTSRPLATGGMSVSTLAKNRQPWFRNCVTLE